MINEKYTFKQMTPDRLFETLTLVRDVFMEFEAPDYSLEGINEFLRFLEPLEFMEMIENDIITVWICEYEGKIAGMIAGRNDHISLMFVDGKHHKKGIAGNLICFLKDYYKPVKLTVNSSPYAVEAYKKLGFNVIGNEQTEKGIRFIPMEWVDE